MDYCCHCGKLFGQKDDVLQLNEQHKATKGFIETVTYTAQMIPGFDNAAEIILRFLGIEVSGTQLQIISEEVGKELFEKEMAQANEAYDKPELATPAVLDKDKLKTILYIMADGSSVNTRVEVDGTTWKEMKLGMVFKDKDVIKRAKGSAIITQKEYVTYFGSVEEFKKILFAAAAKAGYGSIETVVVIGDGAKWIWNMCEELFPDAECILDYYHLTENVNNYAKAIYPADEIKRKIWVNKILEYIDNGDVLKALSEIDRSPLPNPSSNVVKLKAYISNNIDKVKYPDFRQKGYYIGSGMIESANKTVIQKRMKQAGMRWSIDGGQYMAVLRAKYESKLWNDVVDIINAA